MAEHLIRNGAKKVAKGAVDIAKQATGEAIGKMATSGVKRTEERLFEGKPRGRLLTLLSEMPEEDTKNLWRHHQEVLEDDDPMAEDRFIHNLIKLLGEGEGADDRCKVVLKYLNDLEDDQFEQAVELLENDAVAQVLQKIKLHTWETVRDILIKAAETAKKAGDKVGEVAGKGAKKVATTAADIAKDTDVAAGEIAARMKSAREGRTNKKGRLRLRGGKR